MVWCQGAQNIGLSNYINSNTRYRAPYDHRMMHARPRQTDRQTDRLA